MNGNKMLRDLEAYMGAMGLSRRELAAKLGVPPKTVEPWFSTGKSRHLPSPKNLEKIQALLATLPLDQVHEAERRTEKLKWGLLIVEDELRWFRQGSAESREVLRNLLDPFDAGYISSLLTMIQEEEAFQRWRRLTTNRFNAFKRRSGHGQKSGDSRKSG